MKSKKEIFKLPEKISGGGPAIMKDRKKKIVFLRYIDPGSKFTIVGLGRRFNR